MGKRSGGTRGTNSINSSSSRKEVNIAKKIIDEGSLSLIKAAKSSDFDVYDDYTKSVNFADLANILRYGGQNYNDPVDKIIHGEKPYFESRKTDMIIAKYLDGKYGDFTSEQHKAIADAAKNGKSIRGELYRGYDMYNQSLREFLSKYKKGKIITLNDIGGKKEGYVSMSTEKVYIYSYNDFQAKKAPHVDFVVKGKINGIDLSISSEREFIANGDIRSKIKKVTYDKAKNHITVEINTI